MRMASFFYSHVEEVVLEGAMFTQTQYRVL